MMKIEERIRQADLAMQSATVSLEGLTPAEIKLADQLCLHFKLPLGTLLRRASAIELIGGAESVTDRLREAAQHLIYV
jgi:hypothetical protein